MQSRLATAVTLLWIFFGIAPPSHAQTACPAPPPARGTAEGNIFTEQQEMDLGDAIADRFEHNFHVIDDVQLNAYLNEIAQRLLAQMPPTQMKFRIVLVDLPTVNAFTMPGGRIYVTRKLVAFVRSEDELAGVLGHELGHALTHQPAADMSKLFREVLGVTQVGDRADIFLKYNQLIDNIARKHLHFDSTEDRQDELVADSYALYAMTRAGYLPQAMASFWDRRAQTEGKTGNWLTDFFGATTPNEQRLRQMRQYNPAMPPACIAEHVSSAAKFEAWRQSVIGYSAFSAMESLPGLLWRRQLSPPLESEISNVKFSPDGKYLLAQDDFSVYVLSREPFRSLFRIPVENAEPASFTPDSRAVLIWTRALHVEKWDIASQQRTDVHEVVTPNSCVQAAISPDGALAACVQATLSADLRFDFSLVDVATGSPLIVKENFLEISRYPLPMFFLFAIRSSGLSAIFHMAFSPDGHYFAVSAGDQDVAWDLRSRAPVKLSAAVRDRMSGGFVFDGPNHIVGINLKDPRGSGGTQFPSGPADKAIAFYQQTFSAPTHGVGVLVRPAGDNAVALVDLKTAKAALTSKVSALDVYDSVYARPQPDGSIGIFDLSTRKLITSTPLLGHWMGDLDAAAVSADLKWFAASGATRGAVWNLATGDRIFHIRGFDGCGFSPQDDLYADFTAYLKEKRGMGVLDPSKNTIQPGVKLDEDTKIVQLGTYLLYLRRPKNTWNGPVDFEVHDAAAGTTLWTKHLSRTLPQVSISPLGDEMALVVPLNSNAAKEEEKQDETLSSESKRISSKQTARLVQVLNAQDGKLLGQFPIDTGAGSFTVSQALPAGKWVVVADNQNRASVYSLDGKLTGGIFGTDPVASGSGLVALQSQSGTIAVYGLDTLTKREELVFGMPLAFYQFVENGSKLFAVTADQTAYLFTVEQSKSN